MGKMQEYELYQIQIYIIFDIIILGEMRVKVCFVDWCMFEIIFVNEKSRERIFGTPDRDKSSNSIFVGANETIWPKFRNAAYA